ncbi:hypothetical protein TNCV_3757751 [Trichonephila clavipes]|nr:hypothetical protein TNCV_3757751 [Trichonephila clavipes]
MPHCGMWVFPGGLSEVVDEHGTVKAWVDTQIVQGAEWTTHLRKPENEKDKNVTPIFSGGQSSERSQVSDGKTLVYHCAQSHNVTAQH